MNFNRCNSSCSKIKADIFIAKRGKDLKISMYNIINLDSAEFQNLSLEKATVNSK